MFEVFKLAKSLRNLEEQMLKLTRIVEQRDLDWTDMRARCKRLLDRTEKAAQRTEEASLPSGEPGTVDNDPTAFGLSPRQTQAQQLILARRRANGLLPPTG